MSRSLHHTSTFVVEAHSRAGTASQTSLFLGKQHHVWNLQKNHI